MMYIKLLSLLFALLQVTRVRASNGDRSSIYQNCYYSCEFQKCSTESSIRSFKENQSILESLLWECQDECKYDCMWDTVYVFANKSLHVPQFYGKWPFIRIGGIQEPASTIFSLFNLLSHSVMLKKYWLKARTTSPYFWLWTMSALISMNAWLWSTIFHTRDTVFTELMDYLCAFSMVLFNLLALLIRSQGTRSKWEINLVYCGMAATLFLYHSYYLTVIKFDYGYNMKMNITVGALNSVGWLGWSLKHYKSQRYVWRCAATILLLAASMSLELIDFPPLFWTLDAHALWHLATSPLPFLWYRFIIDDTHYLEKYDYGKST